MLWPCKFLACWDPVTLWCTTFEWSETCHRFYIPPSPEHEPLQMHICHVPPPWHLWVILPYSHFRPGIQCIAMVFHIWVVRDILGIVAIVDALSFYEVTLWSLIFDEFWFCFTFLLFWTWHPLVYHSWMIWDTLNTGYICVYPYLTSITLPSVRWHFWVVVNLPPLHSWWYPSLMCVEI